MRLIPILLGLAPAGADNTGKEIGRFWVGGTCPSTNLADPTSTWWDLCSTPEPASQPVRPGR